MTACGSAEGLRGTVTAPASSNLTVAVPSIEKDATQRAGHSITVSCPATITAPAQAGPTVGEGDDSCQWHESVTSSGSLDITVAAISGGTATYDYELGPDPLSS